METGDEAEVDRLVRRARARGVTIRFPAQHGYLDDDALVSIEWFQNPPMIPPTRCLDVLCFVLQKTQGTIILIGCLGKDSGSEGPRKKYFVHTHILYTVFGVQ